MNRRFAWLLLLIVCGVGALMIAPDPWIAAQDGDPLVMITNKQNAAAAGITKTAAKKLLLGEFSRWPNGTPVVVVLGPAGSEDRSVLLEKVCGMSEAEFTRHNLQAQFMGQVMATIHQERSAGAMKNFVKSNAGAVGFLHKSEVDDSVKIVWIVQ